MRFESQEQYERSPIYKLIGELAVEQNGICLCGGRATRVDSWYDPPTAPVDENQTGKFPAWRAFNLQAFMTPVCDECHQRMTEARKK